MSAHVPALPVELDPLIAEAKQRARRRRFLLLTLIAATVVVSAAVLALRSSGKSELALTAAPICRVGQLRLALTSGGVAGGTEGDGFTFSNTSTAACTLSGWPTFRLVIGGGRLVMPQPHHLIASAYSVKHPPPIPRIQLAPGQATQWILQSSDGTGLNRMCPRATRMLVVPPGDRAAIAVAAHVPFCGTRYFWELPIGRVP